MIVRATPTNANKCETNPKNATDQLVGINIHVPPMVPTTRFPHVASCPPRGWSGAGVGVGILSGIPRY